MTGITISVDQKSVVSLFANINLTYLREANLKYDRLV